MITRNASSYASSIRRAAGESSLLAFARLYLPHRFGLSPSRMHREVADDLMSVGRRPLRLVLAAPDSYGKTTLVSYLLPIWALAYRRARCIAIGSRTRGAAGELLRGVDQEIRRNALLRSDFPHLADVARSSGASGSRASPPRDLYVGGVARLTTIGPSTSLTEISFEGAPPDLFILDGWPGDDPKGLRRSPLRSRADHKLACRFLDHYPDASLIVAGALTQRYDLTSQLMSPSWARSWTQRRYKAVISYPERFELWFDWAALRHDDPCAADLCLKVRHDEMHEGARVLWPAHESFTRMMQLRAERGWAWFDRHRQCRPLEGDGERGSGVTCVIDPDRERDSSAHVIDDAGYRREWYGSGMAIPPIVFGIHDEQRAPDTRPLPATVDVSELLETDSDWQRVF